VRLRRVSPLLVKLAAQRDLANFVFFAVKILRMIGKFVIKRENDFKESSIEKAAAAITDWQIRGISEVLLIGPCTPSPRLFYVLADSSQAIRIARPLCYPSSLSAARTSARPRVR
jgi:hypothetical protein